MQKKSRIPFALRHPSLLSSCLIMSLLWSFGCQVTPLSSSTDSKRETSAPAPSRSNIFSQSQKEIVLAGRVFPPKECKVHIEFLSVDVVGPEPSVKSACSSRVTPTGLYKASCQLKKGDYAVQLRNTRDGRTLRSRPLDTRRAGLTEIDFEPCGAVAAIELAQPESVPGAPKRDESSAE